MGDLTEVDFRAAAVERAVERNPHAVIGESLAQITAIEEEVEDLLRRARKAEAEQQSWERWQRRVLLDRIKGLHRELQLERAGQFTDGEVLAALKEIGGEVHATEVAARLLRVPSHSAVVRVGLALGRLNRAGHVGRILPANVHETHRWFLKEADNA